MAPNRIALIILAAVLLIMTALAKTVQGPSIALRPRAAASTQVVTVAKTEITQQPTPVKHLPRTAD